MPPEKVDKEVTRRLEEISRRVNGIKNINLKGHAQLDRVGTVTQELTPSKLATIFREAEHPGEMFRLFELYRKIEAYDGKIKGLIEKRRKAPTRFPTKIKNMYPDTPGSGEVVEFVEKVIKEINLKNLMRKTVDGILHGVVLMENVWYKSYGDDRIVFDDPIYISSSRYGQYNETLDKDDPLWGMLYITNGWGVDEKIFLKDIPRYKIYRALYSEDRGFYDIAGIMRPLLKWYLFKYFTYQYWIEFDETYGFPTTVVKVPKDDYQTFRNELEEFLQNVGRNKFGILFNDMEYEVHAQSQAGQVDFFRMLEQSVNREIVFTILGQDLSQKGSTPTTYAESVTGYKMEDDLIIDDSEFVDEAINENLIEPLIWFNYQDKFPLDVAKFYTNTPERKDWQKIKSKWELAAKLGIKGVRKEQIADELEIEFADEGEESVDLYWQQKPNGGEHGDDRNEKRTDGGSVADKEE